MPRKRLSTVTVIPGFPPSICGCSLVCPLDHRNGRQACKNKISMKQCTVGSSADAYMPLVRGAGTGTGTHSSASAHTPCTHCSTTEAGPSSCVCCSVCHPSLLDQTLHSTLIVTRKPHTAQLLPAGSGACHPVQVSTDSVTLCTYAGSVTQVSHPQGSCAC